MCTSVSPAYVRIPYVFLYLPEGALELELELQMVVETKPGLVEQQVFFPEGHLFSPQGSFLDA